MDLTTRGQFERNLPPIWQDGFNHERLDFYVKLMSESDLFKGGRDTICEFVAAMLMESGLDNLTIGNNAKNGSLNTYLGVSWCQLDTGYHATTVEKIHLYRSDPLESLKYIAMTPDLCRHGGQKSWFNKRRWHAWEVDKIDPATGWNPLENVQYAWDRVHATA